MKTATVVFIKLIITYCKALETLVPSIRLKSIIKGFIVDLKNEIERNNEDINWK